MPLLHSSIKRCRPSLHCPGIGVGFPDPGSTKTCVELPVVIVKSSNLSKIGSSLSWPCTGSQRKGLEGSMRGKSPRRYLERLNTPKSSQYGGYRPHTGVTQTLDSKTRHVDVRVGSRCGERAAVGHHEAPRCELRLRIQPNSSVDEVLPIKSLAVFLNDNHLMR